MAPQRLDAEIVLKSPADKYFKRLSSELHHLPDAIPDQVHGVEVHEGDFKTHGSIKSWTYTLNGKKEVFKEKFEIDEENMSLSMVAVDGHILERCKSYKIMYKVITKEDGTAAVLVSLVYEKLNESDPDLHTEMDFMIRMMKGIDEHLIQQ